MKRLVVESAGPIRRAEIEFGDLTVLVGPQASGKSIFAQLVKVIEDAGSIQRDFKQYGFDWTQGTELSQGFSSLYFGGGLEDIFEGASVTRDGKRIDLRGIAKPRSRVGSEKVFLIPAQRVLVLQDGWPKPFMGYSAGDPYSMRKFSESLRLSMEKAFKPGATVFPNDGHLYAQLREVVDDAIYVGSKLELQTEGMRKRVMLKPQGKTSALPYSAWSAGQREFTPLLLALYWLMPQGGGPRGGAGGGPRGGAGRGSRGVPVAHASGTKSGAKLTKSTVRRDSIETVIIEEPEMGLHPQAIITFGLLVLELLGRGYRVIISTHSPVILDLVWALRELSSVDDQIAIAALEQIFNGDRKRGFHVEPPRIKQYRTYYFHRTEGGVVTEDISTLDPGDENEHISGWGGLSGFSGRIARIIGEALSP